MSNRGGYGSKGGGGYKGGGGGRGGGVVGPKTYIPKDDHEKPSENVKNLEESLLAKTQAFANLSITQVNRTPFRPGYGTQGREVLLATNYFKISVDKFPPVFRYTISVFPVSSKKNASDAENADGPAGKKLQRIVFLALQELPSGIHPVTDYKSTLLTTQKLERDHTVIIVNYFPETVSAPGRNPPQFRVTFEYSTQIQIDEFLKYLRSADVNMPMPVAKEEVLQALNILVGHGFKANPAFIARRKGDNANVFYPHNPTDAGQNTLGTFLDGWRGLFLSARAASGNFLLLVQPKHVSVWKPLKVSVVVRDWKKSSRYNDHEAERLLKKVRVEVDHIKGGKRHKTIAGYAAPGDGQGLGREAPIVPRFASDARQTQFWIKSTDGSPSRRTSVFDYFRRIYNITLRHPDLPVLNTGSRQNPAYTPPELCTIIKGNVFMTQLPPDETKEMIMMAVRNPALNAKFIHEQRFNLLQRFADTNMAKFGVTLGNSLMTVNGRILPTPTVKHKNGQVTPQYGSWNLKNNKVVRGSSLPAWKPVMITLAGKTPAFGVPQDHEACMHHFTDVLRSSGITIPNGLAQRPYRIHLPDVASAESLIKTNILAMLTEPKPPQVLFVILPDSNKIIQNAVKKAGDIDAGIHTFCMIASKSNKMYDGVYSNFQYFANVALKVNLKLGGVNQQLFPKSLGIIEEGKTMLVGLDVTHPSPGSRENAPSVVGIVASVDSYLGQWPADVRIQTGRKEMVEALQELFESRLKMWYDKNENKYPESIIVYRDGVSEGQYKLVLDTELPQIKAACSKVYSAKETEAGLPRITVIVVGKRHHTRFYPTTNQDGDRNGNPYPGTVVDRGVTETRIWDFFLQAHAALQGTAKPAHYVVVHDEIFRYRAKMSKIADKLTDGQRAAEELEKITHSMCYMYGRATKAVSVCPPAYYADLVCERARVWLNNVFEGAVGSSNASVASGAVDQAAVTVHPNLKNTMFYI